MMPEPRAFPRWLPRPGAKVTITFGEAVNKAVDPILDRLSAFVHGPAGAGDLDEALAGMARLSADYPVPAPGSFPPHTPLVDPPGGVPWPVPLPDSRSAKAIARHGESPRARAARSIVAAELRAHLAQLGSEQGGDLQLVHRLL